MISEASFNGTVRTILVLVALWLVVRWWMRRSANGASRQAPRDARKPGDVRIENTPPRGTTNAPAGRIVDADFEEIK
jgi:hypothetical protein